MTKQLSAKKLLALVLSFSMILSLFAVTGTVTASAEIAVTCEPPEGGYVTQEDYDDGDWRLTAVANPGYVFDHFTQGGNNLHNDWTFNESNGSVVAYFNEISLVGDVYGIGDSIVLPKDTWIYFGDGGGTYKGQAGTYSVSNIQYAYGTVWKLDCDIYVPSASSYYDFFFENRPDGTKATAADNVIGVKCTGGDGKTEETAYIFELVFGVTGVTLDKTETQSVNVGRSVAFTASIAPDIATDKTVKWSTTGGVTLYSDSNCTQAVGTGATDKLTVYAKGVSEGNATVTVTSNQDNTKTASCAVTVNPPHAHNFTYSANGATITATCGDGCDITEGLSLTISTPEGDLMYDGTAKNATLSTGYSTEAFPDNYTIVYTKDGQSFTGEPIDAGDYTASVTVGNATASVEYTIEKRPVLIRADNQTKELEQNDPELTITCSGLAALLFENNSSYPWILVTEGDRVYAQSGNKGVSSSQSYLTLHVTLSKAGTVSFDFKAWGEGSNNSSPWDKCVFKIDGTEMLKYGAYDNDWETRGFTLSAGEHALIWEYTKDGSVNPTGDYFAIDNVEITNIVPQPGDMTELDRAIMANAPATAGGGLVEGETLNYTISREEGETAGDYAIIVTPGDNPNYEVTAINGVFTIVAPPVSGVVLTPDTPQAIDEGGVVTLTATVEPDLALDKTVIWTVDSSNVKLYSDENCTAANMIGSHATDIMTVYVKGFWVGNATVTVTSNEDNTKSASCVITVNKADLPEIIEDCTYQFPEYPIFANVPFLERDPIESVYGAMIVDFESGMYYALDARQYQYKFYDRTGNEIPADIAQTDTMPGSYFGLSDDVTIYVTGYPAEAFENADAVYIVASCTVTWKDGDNVLETDDVPVGNTPKFNGETPTKSSDDTYDYDFAGWTDGKKTYAPNELPTVTEPTTYTAVFTATERYEAVKALINELLTGNDVTLTDEQKINEARAAYDALSDTQKQKIDNDTLTNLTNAEAGLDDAKSAAEVENMINDLGNIELNDNCKDKLTNARSAYDNLTDAQKARVKNAIVLEYAEKAFDALEAKESADEAAAEAQAAQKAAEDAKESADQAAAEAQAAQKAAEEAKESADQAAAEAQAAQKAAEEAKEAAEADKAAAEAAQAEAEAAQQAAEADKAAAEAAQAEAEAAQQAAEAAQAEAEAAQQAAEAAQAEAEAAQQAAEADKAAAEAAQAEAEAAQAEAEAAQAEAEAAQQAAEADKAAAEAAQAAAEAAQAEAEAAQAEAEAAQQAAEDKAKAAEDAKESADEAAASAKAEAEAAKTAQQAAENKAKAAEEAKESADEAAKAAEDKAKSAEEAKKSADEAAKAAEDKAKSAEEAKKSADEAAKAAEDKAKSAEEAKKSADEAAKAAEDKAKAAEEAKKSADEAAKAAEDKAKAAEEAKESADEAAKAAEDKAKAAEEAKESADEAAKAAEDKAKAAEEAKESADEAAKAAEDRAKSAEDRAKTAEEATKVAVEKAIQETTDKLTAQGVAFLINELPKEDSITVYDKVAIAKARAAYEALTADQKALIDEDTLKKLTDAETALAALEKGSDTLIGDVNGDGSVDSADALLVLRASVGLDDLDDEKKLVCDVNGDGTVDSADALDVLRYSVGLSANENIGNPVTKKAA